MRAEALTSAFAVAQEFNFGGGERGVRVRGGGAEQEGEGTYLSIREIIAELGKPTGAPHAENGFGTGGDDGRSARTRKDGVGGGDGLSGAHDALTSRSASGARSSAAPDGPRSPTRAAPFAAGGAATLRTFRYRNSTAPSPRLPSPPPHRPLTAQAGDAPLPPAPAAPPQVFFISARSETIPPAL